MATSTLPHQNPVEMKPLEKSDQLNFRELSQQTWKKNKHEYREEANALFAASEAQTLSRGEETSTKYFRHRAKHIWQQQKNDLREEAQALLEQCSLSSVPITDEDSTEPVVATAAKSPEQLQSDRVDSGTCTHRARLVEFYTKYNPSKVDSVDQTLANYLGREEQLFQKLKLKYQSTVLPLVERQRVRPVSECQTNPRVFFTISIGGKTLEGQIVMRLLADIVPLAAENFRCLCTGEKGIGPLCTTPLHFKGSFFHRIIRNFMIQGGDITTGNGTGGISIYGGTADGDVWGKFKDETFLSHDSVGLLSMANSGRDSNSSQFFITTADQLDNLNNKHVVFGEVISGLDIVNQIQQVPVDATKRPERGHEVKIEDCGQMPQ